MPIIHSNLLNGDLNWTDQEVAAGKKYLKWEEVTINWESVQLTWDEVFILLEVYAKMRRGGGGGALQKEEEYQRYVDGNPWMQVRKDVGDEGAKKIVRLFCRVNGVEYDETREPQEQIKITVDEFERFVKEAVSVKIGF